MATWLRTGTASFTNGSATVTLAGVDVIAAAIRQGDALHGPDGRVYEIDSIDTATQVTLATTYLGSTAATQPYAIQPTRGVVTSLYDSVQALITSVSGYVSGILAGLFPAGTAGAPSIAKSGDTNTGVYWPASDQFAIATGGVQRALFTSTAVQVDVPITGTAVQSSATDATAGRLMATGAFGLGLNAGPVVSALDTHYTAGFYFGYGGGHDIASSGANPYPTLNGAFALIVGNSSLGGNDAYVWQEAFSFNITVQDGGFRRIRSVSGGGWSEWAPMGPQGFGLIDTIQASTETNLNNYTAGFAITPQLSICTNTPPEASARGGRAFLQTHISTGGCFQLLAIRDDGEEVYTRTGVGAVSDGEWKRVLHRETSILGTVSQTAGVPTGAVIERGSNSNGEYVRFADGTQICDVRLASSGAGSVTWTFPTPFTSTPQVTATPNADSGRMAATNAAGAASVTFSIWNTSQVRVDAISTSLIAVGRWF